MNKIARTLIFVIIAFALAGCGIVGINRTSGETPPEQSKFKENFSIGTIIEGHQELLIDGPRTLSGMEAGPRVPFVQRQEQMSIQIDDDNITALMNSIQSDIEETLRYSGATIVGDGGSDGYSDPIAYFSYSYSEYPFYGVIDVWAIRGEETDLIIIVQITESFE
jgi:hypothetical protein